MPDPFRHILLASTAREGWDAVVQSMKGAIEDRTHVVILAVAVGLLLLIYINYRIARWLEKRVKRKS